MLYSSVQTVGEYAEVGWVGGGGGVVVNEMKVIVDGVVYVLLAFAWTVSTTNGQ